MVTKTFKTCLQKELDDVNLEMIEHAFPSLKGEAVVTDGYLIISPKDLKTLLQDQRFAAPPNNKTFKPQMIGTIMGLSVIVTTEMDKIKRETRDEPFNPSRR